MQPYLACVFVLTALWHGVHELCAIASRQPANHRVAGGPQYFHDLCLVGSLKNLATSPWYVAALARWGIALFESLLLVPANRMGYTQFNVGQLKILQEVITPSVFVPFAVFSLDQPLQWDCLWAGLCRVGAAYFIFHSGWLGALRAALVRGGGRARGGGRLNFAGFQSHKLVTRLS